MIAIRASSLGDLFDCPARWEARHIYGKYIPSSGKAALGKAIHASTAVFDQSNIDGTGITVDESAAMAVDAIYQPDEEVIWQEDENQKVAEKIAIALHKKYCAEIAPNQDYAAVEIQCDDLEITDLGISLTGTTDRVRVTEEGYGISDIKTGKTAVSADGKAKTAGHAYQLGVYELLAEFASGLAITQPAQVIGLNTGKTEKAQRAGIGEIANVREVLLGDEHITGVLEIASKLVHSGAFYGNPKSMLCSEKFCPIFKTCNFRR